MHSTASPQRRPPTLEVADIFRAHGEEYRRSRPLCSQELRVMRDIELCRTAALGGHLDVCNNCGYSRPSYNSCRNRHCPKCQGLEQARWIEARKARVLPVRHFHVVFTLPADLRALAMVNRVVLFDLLFEAAARTLLDFSKDDKWLGAQPGLSIVLHTWTRDLQFHPHVHCVISDGGLTRDGERWVPAKGKGKFIFPVKALSKVFRAKFLDAMVGARDRGELLFSGRCALLADDEEFGALKQKLYRQPWVVYAKRPFRGVEHVFEYLGRYTHRVAISNHRLLSVDDDHVLFRTKGDKTARLHAREFIRRFLLHILPSRFVKIRHYGLYASGNVKTRLLHAHHLIDAGYPRKITSDTEDQNWRDLFSDLTGVDLERCPRCGIGLFSPQPLDWRPPHTSTPDSAPPPS